MPSIPINIFTPEGGLNASLATNRIADQDASETSNMLYERGIMRTAFGFSIITSNGMPLSEPVHGIWQFSESSGQEVLVAVTRTKIFRRDLDLDDWVDISNATTPLNSNLNHPVSFVEVAHTDGIGTGSDEYHHLLICDGGNSPIQRWPGEGDLTATDLDGGQDYHTQNSGVDLQTHFARQVGLFKNHTILMNPLEDISAATGVLTEQPQRIRWSDTGLLETRGGLVGNGWDDTGTGGAGHVLLLDTSDFNVRMALMGEMLIVYQKNSIWGMVYVGGNLTFDPRVLVQSVGLLAPGLLLSYRNAHYFVGSDFNVYEYFGGGVIRDISAPKSISDRLKDDLDATVVGHARIGIEAKGRRINIGVVMEGDNHIRRTYTRNMTTGAWGVHDYNNYTTAATGVTAMVLAGSERSVIGQTYKELEAIGTKYVESYGAIPGTTSAFDWYECILEHRAKAAITRPLTGSADPTYWQTISDWTTTSYTLGDFVLDDRRGAGNGLLWVCVKAHTGTSGNKPGLLSPSAGEAAHWVRLDLPLINNIARNSDTLFTVTFESAHGLDAVTDVREGDTLTFRDCVGTGLTVPNGERTIVDIPSTTTVQCSSIDVAVSVSATGSATLCKFREGSAALPDVTYKRSDKGAGAGGAASDYPKYTDFFEELLAEETMVIGDQAGNVYSFGEDETSWGGTNITANHETKEHDFEIPERRKRFEQIIVEAKGTQLILGFSIDREAYTDFSVRTLTSDFKLYRFFINRTGHNIRLRFKDNGGAAFQIRTYGFPNVQAQDFV